MFENQQLLEDHSGMSTIYKKQPEIPGPYGENIAQKAGVRVRYSISRWLNEFPDLLRQLKQKEIEIIYKYADKAGGLEEKKSGRAYKPISITTTAKCS